MLNPDIVAKLAEYLAPFSMLYFGTELLYGTDFAEKVWERDWPFPPEDIEKYRKAWAEEFKAQVPEAVDLTHFFAPWEPT